MREGYLQDHSREQVSPVQAICTEDKLIEASLFSLCYRSVRTVENGGWQSQLIVIFDVNRWQPGSDDDLHTRKVMGIGER